MVKACPTLIPYVYDFLENKAYSKGKGEFARKVSAVSGRFLCSWNGIMLCTLQFMVSWLFFCAFRSTHL